MVLMMDAEKFLVGESPGLGPACSGESISRRIALNKAKRLQVVEKPSKEDEVDGDVVRCVSGSVQVFNEEFDVFDRYPAW